MLQGYVNLIQNLLQLFIRSPFIPFSETIPRPFRNGKFLNLELSGNLALLSQKGVAFQFSGHCPHPPAFAQLSGNTA